MQAGYTTIPTEPQSVFVSSAPWIPERPAGRTCNQPRKLPPRACMKGETQSIIIVLLIIIIHIIISVVVVSVVAVRVGDLVSAEDIDTIFEPFNDSVISVLQFLSVALINQPLPTPNTLPLTLALVYMSLIWCRPIGWNIYLFNEINKWNGVVCWLERENSQNEQGFMAAACTWLLH